ncbi:Autophagy-related protein 29 [Ceratocystis fimbriata CBS 114723]|uniref:Autophagy-related protein 29 n=1 Tax=Ceratocystis fimbriata CBS 114723 TaxID=1035309 RepID=A0A2C5X9U9_9PEZI|nr:Autophagy-related protein 29 [Ceratocystis fimbriata CBS 114723]
MSSNNKNSNNNNNCLVFIRVPRPRADFVDPPPYEWDSTKDNALWNILTTRGGKADVDWNEMAAQFNVTAEFLLRQANYLNERHASHLKAEVRRATNALKSSPWPATGTTAAPAADLASRPRQPIGVPSHVRDISATPPFPGSGVASFNKHPPSLRNGVPASHSSTRPGSSEKPPSLDRAEPRRQYSDMQDAKDQASAYAVNNYPDDHHDDNFNATGNSNNNRERDNNGGCDHDDDDDDNDDNDDSSNASSSPGQSRIIRRLPLYDTLEDDSEPAFHVDHSSETSPLHSQTMTSTLRGEASDRRVSRTNTALSKHHHNKHRYQMSQASDSSNNSSFVAPMPGPNNQGSTATRSDTKKAKKDPHHSVKNSKVSSKSSDMGSSFSDLDGESFSNSVSTSAMADVLAGLDMSRLTLGGSSINRFVNRGYGQ